mmetsp:Transcript_1828/g.5757  ORF Transcript_1828/g.5757 Transcript_1828/m.5757 type:complete len:267 (-) Transcript_1828:619-1419(-)
MPFLVCTLRPLKLWNLTCLTPHCTTEWPLGENASASVLFLSPLACIFILRERQSYTATVWSSSWPTAASLRPSGENASWMTARVAWPWMMRTASMTPVVSAESQMTILGLRPISPVATKRPSGCTATAMMSSVWSMLKRCECVSWLYTMPTAAAEYATSPECVYRRLLRASCARYPWIHSRSSVEPGADMSSGGGAVGTVFCTTPIHGFTAMNWSAPSSSSIANSMPSSGLRAASCSSERSTMLPSASSSLSSIAPSSASSSVGSS